MCALVISAASAPSWAGEVAPLPAVSLPGPFRPEADPTWMRAQSHLERAWKLERDRPVRAVEHYLNAARLFEEVGDTWPSLARAHWRSARAYWLAGDALPIDATERRLELFERAETLSVRGLEADPICAECMLWKFAAMGRLRTTRGVWTGMSQLSEMAALLDRAIELAPTHVDNEFNSTLGNLHYSSAIFYRIFPDWSWLELLVGVKGDKERALSHIQKARLLHPARLDYQVELGSQLLCLGTSSSDPARITKGHEVMRRAVLREPESQHDAREIAAAQIMLDHPEKSCGYSGDTWVEIDRKDALRAARTEAAER